VDGLFCSLQVKHVCLVVVSADFNPSLYSSLSQILLNRFTESLSPIAMLEVFLQLMTHGSCESVHNGTVSARDFDAKHWALTQSRVKGSFWIPLRTLIVALNAAFCDCVICLTHISVKGCSLHFFLPTMQFAVFIACRI